MCSNLSICPKKTNIIRFYKFRKGDYIWQGFENDYKQISCYQDYVDSFRQATVTYEKGFMDVNRYVNIQDIFDNYKNSDMGIMQTFDMDRY